jgi:hypothetical protein
MEMTAEQWIAEFCGQIGVEPPDQAQFEAILRLASVAAHASERMAAPVACWVAGTTGRPVSELIAVAEALERA